MSVHKGNPRCSGARYWFVRPKLTDFDLMDALTKEAWHWNMATVQRETTASDVAMRIADGLGRKS